MTALLTRSHGRLPIGWLQLSHAPTRMAAAVADVGFAAVLVKQRAVQRVAGVLDTPCVGA